MKYLDEFIIPLSGSQEGVSEHTFLLKKEFFAHFEDAEILDSDVEVRMTLRKTISLFEMEFTLTGDLTVNCDRCLDALVQPIQYSTELFVKYGERYEEVDDKVVTIGPNEDTIYIAPFIFEYAKLALPIQRTHEEDQCNQEMIEQMQKYIRYEEEEVVSDSRWDALAKLKDELK